MLPPFHPHPALKGTGWPPDSEHMADEWTRPDDDGSSDEGASMRPFDRQALQATLADAVRTASDAEVMDNPPNKPLRGPTAGTHPHALGRIRRHSPLEDAPARA